MKRTLSVLACASAIVTICLAIIAVPALGSLPYITAGTAGTWTLTGSMRSARVSPMAVTLPNGDVLVAGGFNNKVFASAELYNPQSGAWSPTGTMRFTRYGASMTVLTNGKVLVAGGFINTFPDVAASAELY